VLFSADHYLAIVSLLTHAHQPVYVRLKIKQYLRKLCSSEKGSSFFDSQCRTESGTMTIRVYMCVCLSVCLCVYCVPSSIRKITSQRRLCVDQTYADDTLSRNRCQETCTGFLQVSCNSIPILFWYRSLVRVRALLYSVKETGRPTGFLVPVSG